MKQAIRTVVEGNDLSLEEAKRVMQIMLSGEATQAQLGSFLTALRMKGETLEEIVGCAMVMQNKAEHISPKVEKYIDLVGTGGDSTYSFNISTTAAFVVAAAGLPVAKHGNRSISSKSGAADVLEALGVNIMLEPDRVEKSVEEVGIGFMFAQSFNKSMKNVGQARSEMGIRSIFNILGPLSNPSGAKHQVIGVFNSELTEVFARAMKELGIESAIVMHAKDGMDEISTASETDIAEIVGRQIKTYSITPEQYGFKRAGLEDYRGGDGKVNAGITKEILSGAKGPKRDIVLFNAGATLYVGRKAASIEDGILMAEAALDSGAAMRKLEELIRFSNF